MTIKQITLSGFKSFARPTSFRLDSGVTAVVGPNGSGKSNLADALRWVLGEQSTKALRIKKADDLIFGGTEGKARGSVAEVRLLLDNTDGVALPELAEIELSRKLYGSGESEYRLNGRAVRLAEVQELLAKARIGAGSYAITSQGTIDSLILATPAERKLLFEEASGIKEFELQRGAALKRLRATEDNMQRARDVLAELVPRLATLERNRRSAQQYRALEAGLEELRQQLQAAQRRELAGRLTECEAAAGAGETRLAELAVRQTTLRTQQKALSMAQKQAELTRKRGGVQVERLEAARQQLFNDLSVQQAELQYVRERFEQADGLHTQQAAAKQAVQRQAAALAELQKRLVGIKADQAVVSGERDGSTQMIRKLQQRLMRQRKALQELNQTEYVSHAQTIISDIHRALQDEAFDRAQLQSLTYRVRRLLKLATEHNQEADLAQLQELQVELGNAIRRREALDERYTHATLTLRSIELDVAAAQRGLAEAETRLRQLAKELAQAEQAGSHVAQREAAIAALQERLQASQADSARLRQEQAAAAQPAVEEVVAVQVELAALATEQAAVQQERQTAQAEVRRLAAKLKAHPAGAVAIAPQSLPELEHQILQSESKLAALQELGQDVEAEHAEVKERHDFLEHQLVDLEKGRDNLLEIIQQLSVAMQAQFATAFAEISERFGQLFGRLFGGGTARLVLDETAEAAIGIEIEVVPPGKRVRHLAALSGGERSLAGIALLAAIVQINPSPILVLDEVDAALDETNARRFSELLGELAEYSQVLAITHNRQTMVAASTLFGVTMDHQNVSQTVSVQLDEAAALAEAA